MPIIGIQGAGLGGAAMSTIKKAKKRGYYNPGKSGLPSPGRSGQQAASKGTGVPRDSSKREKPTSKKSKKDIPLTQLKGYRLYGGK